MREEMLLAKQSVASLIDLIEIKLNCLQIHDSEDSRIVKHLEKCRDDLSDLINETPKGEVISLDRQSVA